MAVNLIRKNNGAGITAFQDSVLFHLSKGVNGVIKDVHNEFSTTYNNTTKNGMSVFVFLFALLFLLC